MTVIRNGDSRHVPVHVGRHTGRLERRKTGQDEALLVQPHIAGHLHELPESVHIVDALGLDEISTGPDFFRQPDHPELERIGKRIGRRSQKHPDRPLRPDRRCLPCPRP